HGFGSGVVGIRYVTGIAVDQTMNPVVQSPSQTPEHALGIKCAGAIAPAGENHLLFIGHPVVIRVLEKEQVRNRTNKQSAVIAMDGRGPAKTPGKDSRFVKTPVAIGILQPPDLSAMLFAVRIIIHLDDEE